MIVKFRSIYQNIVKKNLYYLVCKPYLDPFCIIDTESNNEKDNNYSEAAFIRFNIEFQ